MVTCVVPAFRAADSIAGVVRRCLERADKVIVVDDGCPQETGLVVEAQFGGDSRVELLRHQKNRGVGAAVKTGIRRANQLGASVIVKVDADGQMDTDYIPQMTAILAANPRIALVKGNRFFDGSIVRVMPGLRLFGNSILTLLVRITTGYWNSIDPTNGFFALRGRIARKLKFERLADRYFFEISLLVELGLRRLELAEIEIPAIYGNESSSLSIWKTIATFPSRLGSSVARRIFWQYIVADMNVGSLFLVFGSVIFTTGCALGGTWWAQALASGTPRTPGTVTIVLALLIVGFQLLLNAVLFDVQSGTRVYKFAHDDTHEIVDADVASVGAF